jgi:hypothetical protein
MKIKGSVLQIYKDDSCVAGERRLMEVLVDDAGICYGQLVFFLSPAEAAGYDLSDELEIEVRVKSERGGTNG